jgi:hypothetical protein
MIHLKVLPRSRSFKNASNKKLKSMKGEEVTAPPVAPVVLTILKI